MKDAVHSVEAESRKDPARLEHEIDQQRAQIDHLVEALESRLSPGQLFDRLLQFGKGNGRELAENFGTTVKAHPVPALLTAVGVAWLYASRNEPAPSTARSGHVPSRAGSLGDQAGELGEKAGEAVDRARETGEALAHGVSDRLHQAGSRMADNVHHAGETLAEQKDRAVQGYNRMLEENPLALGAIGMAIGALLGAALPGTRAEDRVMGDARDDLLDKARDALHAGTEKTREAMHDLGEPDRGVRH